MTIKHFITFAEFEPWAGAVDRWEPIAKAGNLSKLEELVEEFFEEEEIDEMTLNDFIWFDLDEILADRGLGEDMNPLE